MYVSQAGWSLAFSEVSLTIYVACQFCAILVARLERAARWSLPAWIGYSMPIEQGINLFMCLLERFGGEYVLQALSLSRCDPEGLFDLK